jgi:hypothetical protein
VRARILAVSQQRFNHGRPSIFGNNDNLILEWFSGHTSKNRNKCYAQRPKLLGNVYIIYIILSIRVKLKRNPLHTINEGSVNGLVTPCLGTGFLKTRYWREERREDRREGRRDKQLLDEIKLKERITGNWKGRLSIALCVEITLAEVMGLSQDRLHYKHTIYEGCCWPHNTTWQTAGREPMVSKVGTKMMRLRRI